MRAGTYVQANLGSVIGRAAGELGVPGLWQLHPVTAAVRGGVELPEVFLAYKRDSTRPHKRHCLGDRGSVKNPGDGRFMIDEVQPEAAAERAVICCMNDHLVPYLVDSTRRCETRRIGLCAGRQEVQGRRKPTLSLSWLLIRENSLESAQKFTFEPGGQRWPRSARKFGANGHGVSSSGRCARWDATTASSQWLHDIAGARHWPYPRAIRGRGIACDTNTAGLMRGSTRMAGSTRTVASGHDDGG